MACSCVHSLVKAYGNADRAKSSHLAYFSKSAVNEQYQNWGLGDLNAPLELGNVQDNSHLNNISEA